ncbi:MAG: AAA family ATPase, partial [Chlamydiales bacterium]
MRLKSLKIFGFKSFADKVSIDFDSEIIGVVGPNGCGKSNIVDAFRWVLGEQSPKSMRATGMQDVLFAGSATRPASNYAEVSVTLSDVGEELAIPYNEVTITRRLYRSGESEYLLNREPVRLKDLQLLFMGSGVGKNAFSVLEQGKIDSVIHLSPEMR